MNKVFPLLLLVGALLAPSAGLSHSHKKKGLEIVHPWTAAMVQKDTTTAQVYMTIKNRSGAPERLLSASTPRAEKVELNAGGGGAEAQAKPAAFTIAPGKNLVLHAKGQHLVLRGVKKQLHAYDDFKMTLVFEKVGRMVIDVVVEESHEDHHH